ncbi:hypothetical protein, partial [Pseudorhodobacter sp. E13]|uniref:hypothetical protein n=1 Tax=Pseudorhodobacter sp. E13 TaxID=2487931 RepID=UPI001F185AB0
IHQLTSASLLGRYASDKTSKRPNRPHISSDIINVKEQKTKTTDRANFLAQPAAVSSSILSEPFQVQRRSVPFVSDRLRFGEAVFRPGVRNPQEQKDRKMTFSFRMPKVALDAVVREIFGTIQGRNLPKTYRTLPADCRKGRLRRVFWEPSESPARK